MTPPIPATVGESTEALPASAAVAWEGLPRGCRVWLLLCAVFASSLIFARAIHYTDLPLPELVDRAVDRLMQQSLHTSVLLWSSVLHPAIVVLALVMLVVRPHWFVRRQMDGRLGTRPWFYALLWSGISLGHAGFDVNPWVALGCVGGGALALGGSRLLSRPFAAVVVAVFLVSFAVLGATLADALAIVGWGGLLALLALLRRRWLIARDVYPLAACLMVATQFGASLLPLLLPRHGGTLLGPGMAYGFCEEGTRGRVYAAVSGSESKNFRDAHIVEYDATRLTKLRDLSFVTQTFTGRYMQLLCLPDTIQVAMARTWIYGRTHRENVMEFDIDDPDVEDPRKVKRSLWGATMGQQLLWDRARDAVFYTSEWSNAIFRLDRRTGSVDALVSAKLIPDHATWVLFVSVNGSLAMAPTPHRARDTFYVGHWLTGSTVYEFELGRRAVRRRFEPRSGCIADLAVDEEYDRVYATSLWGVDVINLKNGRVERRIRTGTGARTPVIDSANGVVYVATTVEGKLRAFDRATLQPLGVIAIGMGARRGHFLAGAGRLLATNNQAHYFWDAAALAKRLRTQ